MPRRFRTYLDRLAKGILTPHPSPMASQAHHESVAPQETIASRYVVPVEGRGDPPWVVAANWDRLLSVFQQKQHETTPSVRMRPVVAPGSGLDFFRRPGDH